MAKYVPTGSTGSAHLASANDRWKSRWSDWLLRSTIFAAAFHAIVLVIWPMWEITRPAEPDRPIELVQINPVAAYGGITDPGEGTVAALPTEEEILLMQEEAGQGEDSEEIDETSGVSLPAEAYALIPEVIPTNGSLANDRSASMILDVLSTITPEIAPLAPDVGWPHIRNPMVITRFLGGHFNEMHRAGGASGYVSVAMWINERGNVEWARVSESSGDRRLDDIALALFEDVVAFSPARSKGRGVPVQVTISVPFTLPW